MADRLRITGIQPWDGLYELDMDANELTTREWGWIKKYSGYMPLTVQQGLEGGDPELFACFALIALRRAGRLELPEIPGFMERLLDEGFGSKISLEAEEAETVVLPPPEKPSSNTPTSGGGSTTSSENPGNAQKPSGIPGSDTSESHPLSWAS